MIKYFFLFFQANSVEVSLLPLSQTHHLVLDLSAQFWSLNLLPKPGVVLRGGPGELLGHSLVLTPGVQKVLESASLPSILAGTAGQNSSQGGS